MTTCPTLRLGPGHEMPQLGYGVFLVPPEETRGAVGAALACGYRAVDTARAYFNEAAVGQALRESGLARDEVHVTTKLFNLDQGYDRTLRACEASLAALVLGQLDLYLIHWPAPAQDRYVESWKAMVRLSDEGRVRAIGVSNFQPDHLRRLADEVGVLPALNQVELHPRLQQRSVRAVHDELGILTQSWSPLGRGSLLGDPVLVRLAQECRRTPAQVALRWQVQQGIALIPKSVHRERMAENAAVFDFALSDEQMARLDALDRGERVGPDPDSSADMATLSDRYADRWPPVP